MEPRPDLRVVREGPDPSTSRVRERKLVLSWIDKLAATALVEGSAIELAEFLELVRGCAEALAGDDATGARRRLLAREIAIAKAALDTSSTVIGDRLRANDASGAMLADRLANSAARRLAILVDAHRAETAAEKRRAFVAIGHAEHVTVEADG